MLTLKKVRYKNFLSTGNTFIEYKLDQHHLTLITGKNGAGKTQTLDAIFYALYNKPYREINKPDLVNDINRKDMLVELEFESNGKEYMIQRGMKPNVFIIYENGIPRNQDSTTALYQDYLETHILKLNYKAFTQTVILGTARYEPFPKLNPQDRRKFIENILDIEIFSVMAAVLKDKITITKNNIEEIHHKIDVLQNQQRTLRRAIEEQNKDRDDIINLYKSKLQEYEREQEVVLSKIEDIQSKIDNIHNENIKNYTQDLSFLETSKTQLSTKVKNIKREIQFLETNNTCPTCTQDITETFKRPHINNKQTKITEYENLILEATNKVAEYSEKQKVFEANVQKINELTQQRTAEETNARNLRNLISVTNNDIIQLQKPVEKNNLTNDLIKTLDEISTFEKDLERQNNNLNIMNVSALLLKDNAGIKTKIVKQYIPVFNNTVNQYLQKMNFFCEFVMDEDFNIKIKMHYQDERTYFGLSAGQQSRIDLAMLFAWRHLAFLRSSVSCNLLFLDEVLDGHLDTEGVDDLIRIIQELTVKENVFIITHKADQMGDKFDNVIRIEMHKKFTVVK